MKILIVDDDPSCVIAMAQFFTTRGYEPEVALDLGEAKRMLTQTSFDAVITDMRLSSAKSTGGFDLIDFVRRQSANTRVMVVTAYDGIDTRREALRRGAESFFVKPVSLDRLAAVLEMPSLSTE